MHLFTQQGNLFGNLFGREPGIPHFAGFDDEQRHTSAKAFGIHRENAFQLARCKHCILERGGQLRREP